MLGYFIRMGLLHNREIKNLKVVMESAFRRIEETRENILQIIVKKENSNDTDIQNLHNRIGFAHTQIEEAYKYTDKRIDKLTEKFSMMLNKNA